MPEGDVVWYTARRLHEALAGRALTRSDFRVPRYATADLAGQLITEAVPRGKHLLIRTGGGLTIHTHLKMEGAWRIRPAGTTVPESHKIRLLLANAEYQAIGYQLGVTELVPTKDEDTIVGHLGPDLLDPAWSEAHLQGAVSNLETDTRNATIAEALLDQRNLAGIGNLYKCEVLFLRGISPWRPVTGIPEPELGKIVSLARRLLDVNKARAGQVTTGLAAGSGTQTSTWVYGRRGAPCRRCGTLVRKRDHMGEGKQDANNDRIIFWCPSCQPRWPRNR